MAEVALVKVADGVAVNLHAHGVDHLPEVQIAAGGLCSAGGQDDRGRVGPDARGVVEVDPAGDLAPGGQGPVGVGGELGSLRPGSRGRSLGAEQSESAHDDPHRRAAGSRALDLERHIRLGRSTRPDAWRSDHERLGVALGAADQRPDRRGVVGRGVGNSRTATCARSTEPADRTSAAALLVVPADNSSGHRSPCGAPSSPPRSLAPVDLIDPARRRLFNRAHTTCKACGDQPAAGGRLLHGTAAKTLQL